MQIMYPKQYEYKFYPQKVPLFTYDTIAEILSQIEKNANKIRITIDLGLTYSIGKIIGNYIQIDKYSVSIETIKKHENRKKDDVVYAYIDGELIPLTIYDDNRKNFYKLKCLGRSIAPTLEINGIHMHRIEGIDPFKDAELKVRSLGKIRNAIILDTCMGLGYTAINAIKYGAKLVITVEKDPNVIKLASFNPWSWNLASSSIRTLHADICTVIREIPDDSFTHIIHDPPRINIAGELYSLELYKEFYRILRPRGKIFHYTGAPGKHTNIRYLKGIKERLEKAGFVGIQWIDRAQGFLAFKL